MEIAALVVGITAGLFVILFGSRGLMDLGRDMAARRRAKNRPEADGTTNVDSPVAPAAVASDADDGPRLPLAPPALYRTVFVGRQAELTTLQAAFDKAAEGQGGVVLLTGDAGMGKTAICLQLGHDGRFGPDPQSRRPGLESFRYDAGSGLPSYDAAVRVSRQLPGDWVVVTRDLYADFGEFALTGLALSAPDGEHALFDHVHLTRTQQDLKKLKPAPPKPAE